MKYIQHMLMGALIAMSVSYIITTIRALTLEDKVFTGDMLAQELIVALLLGIVIGLATLILESERLPYSLLMVIHFLSIQITVFTVGAFLHWYDFTLQSIIFMFLIIVAVYIVSWLIALTLERKDIQQLNQIIHKK